MLGNLIGGFITILVGITLLPAIANLIQDAQCKNGSLFNLTGTDVDDLQFCNVTGASGTLLSLTSLFFAIAIMSVGVGLVSSGLKAVGLI